MAGLRKGIAYRTIKRAYTRKSKYRKKGYIKAVPNSRIIRFNMGDLKKKFDHRVDFISKENVQLRHNSIESCRQIINRHLARGLGSNYHFKIRAHPHHVLRENKMLTGAGADRMQTGMQKAFGRAIGVAAQVKKGKIVFTVDVEKGSIDIAKKSLKKATPRLPGTYSIVSHPIITKEAQASADRKASLKVAPIAVKPANSSKSQ
tara:strand:+ start:1995 stop:2606 length:612 start_codon:yes stop_codon:yes gene_type:complete